MRWLKSLTKRLKRWLQLLISVCSKTYVSEITHKRTKRRGMISAFGEEGFMEMPLTPKGGVLFALEDIAAMTIRCPWCGEPIFIGEPVTLYSPVDPAFVVPEHAAVYSTNPLRLVGCLGWECAETGADRSGFWQPDPNNIGKGHVHLVQSPLEQLLANPQAEMILVQDLSNPTPGTVILPEDE